MNEDNFLFCFKKAAGLKLINPNKELAKVYLKKSRSALNMLSAALEKKENEWILDTSYYAKYFVIYALFMKAGIKSEIHNCTITALKALFVDEGLISQDLYEELEKSKELRVGALYYDEEFGREQILERANAAPEFCLKIESILESIPQLEINKIRQQFETLKKESSLQQKEGQK